MSPASNNAVPVAERALKANVACSRVGVGTVGGMRWTWLSRQGMERLGAKRKLSKFFTAGGPQTKQNTEGNIQGGQAFGGAEGGARGPLRAGGGGGGGSPLPAAITV